MVLALLLLVQTTTQAGGSNSEIIVALITAAATALGSWLLFRGQKSQSAAESLVQERELLAGEWSKFRAAVDTALEATKVENQQLRSTVLELNKTIVAQDQKIREQAGEIAGLKAELSKLSRRRERSMPDDTEN